VSGGGKNSDQDGQESEVEKNLAAAGHQTRGSVTSDKEGTVPGKRVSTRKTREVLRLYSSYVKTGAAANRPQRKR
jgi:hypothetical protein